MNISMNISDELKKVAELRREGLLSEEEFAEAKRQILSQGSTEPKVRPDVQNEIPTADEVQVEDIIYYASRLTSGNLFFPDAVILEDDGIVYRKRSLLGSREEHINYKAVASFRLTNGVFFSTVTIETTGGSQPIVVNGLWKSHARELQDVLREYQIQAQRRG
jgi:hypothetical protein